MKDFNFDFLKENPKYSLVLVALVVLGLGLYNTRFGDITWWGVFFATLWSVTGWFIGWMSKNIEHLHKENKLLQKLHNVRHENIMLKDIVRRVREEGEVEVTIDVSEEGLNEEDVGKEEF